MVNGFKLSVASIGVCAIMCFSISGMALAEDIDSVTIGSGIDGVVTESMAGDVLQAAIDARAAGDVAKTVDIVRFLQRVAPNTEAGVRGLLVMAEMSILGEVDAGLRAEAYRGMLAVRGPAFLDIREGSLGWFEQLDANNQWTLHWQYIKDRATSGDKHGRPFITLVKAVQELQGAEAMWPLLDKVLRDTSLTTVWQADVRALLTTIERENGADAALRIAREITERYSNHSGGIAALWYGWDLVGLQGGEEAQRQYLKSYAQSAVDSRVRQRAMWRLSDYAIKANDFVGAVAVFVPNATKDDLLTKGGDAIEKGAAALAAHLERDKSQIPWNGASTKSDILVKLSDAATAAGKTEISADLILRANQE